MVIKLSSKMLYSLIVDGLAQSKSVTIKAQGRSMTPFIIEDRDQIILESADPKEIKRGDIVLARLQDGRLIAHRVFKIEERQNEQLLFTLRGDGNPSLKEKIYSKDIVAEVVAIERENRARTRKSKSGKARNRNDKKRKSKIIKKGSLQWKLHLHLWPSWPLARTALLKILSLLKF